MAKNAVSTDKNRSEKLAAFDRLLTIMDELRVRCPWDQKQTWASLRHLTIEEVYELADAVVDNDVEGVREELGDVMLHVVFYARIAADEGLFDIAQALHGICEKLIERHPHVYQDAQLHSEEAVKQNWERVKLQKGNRSTLQGVPRSLPALIKAMRIQEKARSVGFDWEGREPVWGKVQEEIDELQRAIVQEEEHGRVQEEFGDVLFSLINYARFIGVNPEEALERANRKFIRRFQYIEEQSRKQGVRVEEMTPADMNLYWEQAKALKLK